MTLPMRRLLTGLLSSLAAAVAIAAPDHSAATPEGQQPLLAEPPAASVLPEAIAPDCAACAESLAPQTPEARNVFGNFARDPAAYSIVSVARGLSTHKPMVLLPYTWSSDYDGTESELLFQFSAKYSLLNTGVYLAYTQKSFWQVYNTDDSRPFRETNYNPEAFYRWTPEVKDWHYWGADIGIEHESNGEDVPASRSWNRLYIAPFRAKGSSLLYAKLWYRIPDDEKKYPEDPRGDDNPDIEDYYGYGELRYSHQMGEEHLLDLMVRGNMDEGRGAVQLNYSLPSRGGYVFWQFYVWHGYGESLIDYNDSVTRVGIGAALAR